LPEDLTVRDLWWFAGNSARHEFLVEQVTNFVKWEKKGFLWLQVPVILWEFVIVQFGDLGRLWQICDQFCKSDSVTMSTQQK